MTYPYLLLKSKSDNEIVRGLRIFGIYAYGVAAALILALAGVMLESVLVVLAASTSIACSYAAERALDGLERGIYTCRKASRVYTRCFNLANFLWMAGVLIALWETINNALK